MNTICNLTQHPGTPEQIADGVVDLPAKVRTELQRLLTFNERPLLHEVQERAQAIAALCESSAAMIGGAPFLMVALENALKGRGVAVLYSFSKRVSIEERQEDGSTKKTSVFRHCGFVEG